MHGVTLHCGGSSDVSGGSGCRIQVNRAPMNCQPQYVIDGRVDNMFTALQNIVPSHLADGTIHDFKGLKLTGVASDDGDKAFDAEEFTQGAAVPSLQVIRM